MSCTLNLKLSQTTLIFYTKQNTADCVTFTGLLLSETNTSDSINHIIHMQCILSLSIQSQNFTEYIIHKKGQNYDQLHEIYKKWSYFQKYNYWTLAGSRNTKDYLNLERIHIIVLYSCTISPLGLYNSRQSMSENSVYKGTGVLGKMSQNT